MEREGEKKKKRSGPFRSKLNQEKPQFRQQQKRFGMIRNGAYSCRLCNSPPPSLFYPLPLSSAPVGFVAHWKRSSLSRPISCCAIVSLLRIATCLIRQLFAYLSLCLPVWYSRLLSLSYISVELPQAFVAVDFD